MIAGHVGVRKVTFCSPVSRKTHWKLLDTKLCNKSTCHLVWYRAGNSACLTVVAIVTRTAGYLPSKYSTLEFSLAHSDLCHLIPAFYIRSGACFPAYHVTVRAPTRANHVEARNCTCQLLEHVLFQPIFLHCIPSVEA